MEPLKTLISITGHFILKIFKAMSKMLRLIAAEWEDNFSDTIAKLSDPATLLYKEGPAYVYSILQDELRCGKL